MRLEYHPQTTVDLNRALQFYESQRHGLGAECRAEIYAAIERIKESPTHYRKVEGEIRRCLVRRFPFSILYRVIKEEVIRVLVIRHHRQHPGFGQSRS
ncbi:MAG: type II toxin-antitoxin system RelE/ParE family toxin [Gammaproteobacteria bacterium]|nr:type II toxin-antitoxin system RelE/ParE family toxin [Gammaproteobacteria bacterium]